MSGWVRLLFFFLFFFWPVEKVISPNLFPESHTLIYGNVPLISLKGQSITAIEAAEEINQLKDNSVPENVIPFSEFRGKISKWPPGNGSRVIIK